MIILTSSIASVAEQVYKNLLQQHKYKSVLFIDTASEVEVGKVEGDDEWLQDDLRSLESLGYQVERYSITGQTIENIETKCSEFDILYMCGGNTLYLLKQLQTTGAFDLIKYLVSEGKPYVGTSAGSQIAAPRIPLYIEDTVPEDLTDTLGFDFTDVFILPHWGADHFKETYLNLRLKSAYTKDELPFLVLNDTQFISVSSKREITIFTT